MIAGLTLMMASWLAMAAAKPGTEDQHAGPQLRVLTPTRGYVLGAPGDRKLVVVIEAIDRSGAGLLTTDSGDVRFVEPNKNTRLFTDYEIARAEYLNNLGETVEQLVAAIPATKLEMADFTITPPIPFRAVKPAAGEVKVDVPADAMVEAASFNFQVQDRTGGRSRAEDGKLIIGLAREIWTPKAP